MCGADGACEPCKATQATSGVALVQAGESGQVAIWGPMSVELPSKDGKLVRIAAVERALPGLLKRARFSIQHNDYAVGEIVPALHLDPARIPSNALVQAMVKEVTTQHGALPTGILKVTQAIAAVFPRLGGLIGKPVAFAGGTIYEDDRIGKRAKEDILAGGFDSFSINGAAFKTKQIEWCDTDGCRQVEDIIDLDISMVTLCGTSPKRTGFGLAQEARNPGAAFVVVQQAESACTGDCATVSTKHLSTCAMAGYDVEKIEQANGTPRTVNEPTADGLAGMTPTPPLQQVKPVTQTDGAPKQEQGQEPQFPGSEQLFMDLRQRVEKVEQDVALLNGQKTIAQAPNPEPEKGEEKKPDEESKEEDSKEEPKPMSQATPAEPQQPPAAPTAPQVPSTPPAAPAAPAMAPEMVTAVQQAVAAALPAALKEFGIERVQQAARAAGEVPQPAVVPVAPLAQAAGGARVTTPEPAPPSGSSAAGNDKNVERIRQAVDSGDPGAMREALLLTKPSFPQ